MAVSHHSLRSLRDQVRSQGMAAAQGEADTTAHPTGAAQDGPIARMASRPETAQTLTDAEYLPESLRKAAPARWSLHAQDA